MNQGSPFGLGIYRGDGLIYFRGCFILSSPSRWQFEVVIDTVVKY